MKRIIVLWIVLMVSGISMGLAQTQTIRGTILDADSGYPLIGVNVLLLDSDPIIGAVTDINGNYSIENAPVGRVSLSFTYIGYNQVILSDQLLEKGKELFLNVRLEEEITTIDEVVITAGKLDGQLNNDAAIVATRAFDIEETRRYAGTRNDVARMATTYAGVINSDDARNDIIIRGNSPSGLLWRLEGIDIPNPNHYNAIGTTGGPVSILNNNNLANSDFFTSAFPSDYGNTVSGVFDLKLRKGNSFKQEFLGQIGFNGLEFGAEGPISKKNRSSYLVNYRYSTLGIFKALGVEFGTGAAIPEYQDLTFGIDLATGKNSSLKLFGVGGISQIHFEPVSENDANGSLYTTADLKNRARVGVVGLRHEYFFNPNLNLSTTLAASQQFTSVIIDSVHNNTSGVQIDDIHTNQTINKISLHSRLNYKIDARNNFTTGIMLDYLNGIFKDSLYTQEGTWFEFANTDATSWLIQAYALHQWKINSQMKFVGGLRYSHLTFNNSLAFEPRLALSYTTNQGGTYSLGYGLHSQMQPLNFYSWRFETAPTETNADVDFTRSHHVTFEYNKRLAPKLHLKTALFYQHIFDAPVESNPSPYSLLNFGTTYGNVYKPNLVNEGLGENYGLELTIEKYFSQSYYFMVSGTVFESRYQGSDKIWRNTGFNSRYSLNVLGGKEFAVGKNGVVMMDLAFTAVGGRYTTPIDLEASRNAGETVYFDELAFTQQYDDYLRTDFKIGYRLNMKRITQEWLIDIQNLFNRENPFEEYYNPQTGNIDMRNQLGRLIIPQYRILF